MHKTLELKDDSIVNKQHRGTAKHQSFTPKTIMNLTSDPETIG
jgi:hypothetical protein